MSKPLPGFPAQFLNYINGYSDVDKRVREVYKALYDYASAPYRAQWLKNAEKCKKAALENEFFEEKEKKDMRRAGQEPAVTNRLVLGIQGSSAVASAQRPDIKVHPLRGYDSDIVPYLAELIKSGLEHVWLKNFGDDVVYDFVEERNITGIGAIAAYRDENKGPFGACVFKEEDVDIWYWDAESRERDRADTHLIKAQLRSVEYIKAHYDLKDKDIVAVNDEPGEKAGELTDTKTGMDNYKVQTESNPPEQPKSRLVWEIDAHMLKTEKEHWVVVIIENEPFVGRLADVQNSKEAAEAVDRIQREGYPQTDEDGVQRLLPVQDVKYWPRRLNNRYRRIIVGDKLIPQPDPSSQGKELPEIKNFLGLDSDGDPVLPVVFYYGQRLSKAYYHGPTFYAYDPNKSLCKREAQYTLAISKNLSAPVVRESTSTRWDNPDRPDTPGNELKVDKSARDPFRLQPGQIDFAALTARIAEDKANIDDTYSLPEVMRGKIPQGLERMSGRLSLALQNGSMLMHNPAIKGLESALGRLGKLLLAIILPSWPRLKWESLVTEDVVRAFAPPSFQSPVPEEEKTPEVLDEEYKEHYAKWMAAIDKLERDKLGVVDFNVAITAGSSLPTNRLVKEELAIEKFKIGLYDRRAALEYADDPHAKEIAERQDKREVELAQAKRR